MSSEFSDDFATAFATAADDAGFREDALVRPVDCTLEGFTLRVAFVQPDSVDLVSNRQSKNYEVEYVASDAPLLAEGDELEIAAVRYKVRRPPYVPEFAGMDGSFRRAALTRLADDCGA